MCYYEHNKILSDDCLYFRRSVEIVEIETKRQQVLKIATNSPSKVAIIKSPHQQKVSVGHVAKVVSEVYGSNMSRGSSSGQESLPLQQKVLICSLLLVLKKEKAKETTIAKVTCLLVCINRNFS